LVGLVLSVLALALFLLRAAIFRRPCVRFVDELLETGLNLVFEPGLDTPDRHPPADVAFWRSNPPIVGRVKSAG